MQRLKYILFFSFLLLMVPAMNAQPAAWEVVIYERAANALHFVTDEGITETINLPTFEGNRFIAHQIAPDNRYLAGLVEIPNDVYFDYRPALLDLAANACCIMPDVPQFSVEEFFNQFSNFSADSTQIALATNTAQFGNNPAPLGGGVLSIVDVATGQALYQMTFSDYYPYLAEFKPDGVRFLPAPLGGTEWFPAGQYTIWQPETNTVLEDSDEFALWAGEILPATGEAINATYSNQFPIESIGMIFPNNVVEYYEAGVMPFAEDFAMNPGRVIFFDADHLSIYANWILGGQAMLVHSGFYTPTQKMAVVFRDGSQVDIPVADQKFVAGTPDGFLLLDSSMRLYHYTYSGTVFNSSVIAQFAPPADNSYGLPLTLLRQPVFDTPPAQTGSFPEFVRAAPQPPTDAVTCPGALPSRLIVGEKGWVLPGDANNLRSAPGRASQQIGTLEGSMGFTVLDGPVCQDGFAWWQVKDLYEMTGWTAEGDGENYWLEPVR